MVTNKTIFKAMGLKRFLLPSHRAKRRGLFSAGGFLLWGLLARPACALGAAVVPDLESDCGGKLETDSWALWDTFTKDYIKSNQIVGRLQKNGDTYALYDIQVYTHNLAQMARVCHRTDRLADMGNLLGMSYSYLEPALNGQFGKTWVCRGGGICNSTNKLINTEVMLCNAQFLGLASTVANGLASAQGQETNPFVELTAVTALQFLVRFGTTNEINSLNSLISKKPGDVVNGSSAFFFTDKPLWMIDLYAELSGIIQKHPDLFDKAGISPEQRATMKLHLSTLLAFFAARTTILDGLDRDGRPTQFADVDRGFWRLYADSKYAGYSNVAPPVNCVPKPAGGFDIKVNIDSKTIPPVPTVGWDISHMRRLVHALDALALNRQAIQEVFGLEDSAMPSDALVRAFAQQLFVNVWNGDPLHPLFSNYMDGTNGWYRVAYDNGTGACYEGNGPSTLSNSFVTGGYLRWAKYVPEIHALGRRVYDLAVSNDPFISWYSDVAYPARNNSQLLTQMMFWPSLVTADTAPPPVPVVSVTRKSESLDLSWTPSADTGGSGLGGYRVDVSERDDFSTFVPGWQSKEVGLSTGTTVANLRVNSLYYVRARAWDNAGNLSDFGLASGRTAQDLQPPTPPGGVTTTALDDSRMEVRWTPSADTGGSGLKGYRLDVAEDRDFSVFARGYQNANVGTVTNVVVEGLKAGKRYFVRVKSEDFALNTAESIPVEQRMPGVEAERRRFLLGSQDSFPFGDKIVSVRIYDKRGKLISELNRQGMEELAWNGRDREGQRVESGVYVVEMTDVDGGVTHKTVARMK